MRTVVTIKWYDDEGELRETRRHEVFERAEVDVEFYDREQDVRVEVRGPHESAVKVREAIRRGMSGES